MSDSAETVARELIDDVGRWSALGYVAGRIIGAQSWRAARLGFTLLIAILRHG